MPSHKSITGQLQLQMGGTTYRLPCTEISTELGGAPSFHDHTIGLRSPNSFNQSSSNLDGQKAIYHYKPALPKITASGPVELEGLKHLLEWARDPNLNGVGDSSRPDAIAAFYKPATGEAGNATYFQQPAIQKLIDLVVSSLSIEVRGGEPVSFNAELVGTSLDPTTALFNASGISATKLLTWDRCAVVSPKIQTGEATGGAVQSFTLNIRNQVQPIYTAKNTTEHHLVMPSALRIGMQEVTGSIGLLRFQHFEIRNQDSLNFTLGTYTWEIGVTYATPNNRASGSNVYVNTLNFQGVAGIGSGGQGFDTSTGVWISHP